VLSVPPDILAEQGAVSSATAAAMAEGVRSLADSDLALATTGIAGPGGGSSEKPVGMVFIALADSDSCMVFCHHFTGSRDAIREATAEAALLLLEEHLAALDRHEGLA
jgi:PncC family amidohydrolase